MYKIKQQLYNVLYKHNCVFQIQNIYDLNSFPARGDYCRLLINFANSLDPDQARQNVGHDLDPKCLQSHSIPERI